MSNHTVVRFFLGAMVVGALGAFGAGCVPDGSGPDSDDPESNEDNLVNKEKRGGASQKWIYLGRMPKLDQSEIVVSLAGHTARISGLLPTDYAGELPFYVEPEPAAGGRTRVHVVYPIATGAVDPSTGKAPAGPGTYNKLYAVPYTPTNEAATWGGFPFMKYHASRGLAFHGPITSVFNAEMGEYEWRLKRGPVSHGCNRMQGEHVVELAHMLGMDMSQPHKSGDTAQLPVKVVVQQAYDTAFGGQVDVDYPALASVRLPSGNVHKFKTWDSTDFPRWVCAYDKNRPMDAHHCDSVGEDRRDAKTGELFDPPAPSVFIGSTCEETASCTFDGGACLESTSGDAGFCTQACEGYCPDLAGHAPTFCAAVNGVGTCLSKASPENQDCAALPGTSIKVLPRFVGGSAAKAAQASVCSY